MTGGDTQYLASVSCQIDHTDWLDLARSLPAASIDLLYADPPFNTGRSQRGSLRCANALQTPSPSGAHASSPRTSPPARKPDLLRVAGHGAIIGSLIAGL